MRVLVIEDYPPIRKAVAKGLREAGFTGGSFTVRLRLPAASETTSGEASHPNRHTIPSKS